MSANAAAEAAHPTFSWGNGMCRDGRVIDANRCSVSLPTCATDADIALLAQLCKKLRDLDAESCTQVTDAGLVAISGWKLQDLDLRGCPKITDDGLHVITGQQELTRLDLDGDRITPVSVQHIACLPLLKTLNIPRCGDEIASFRDEIADAALLQLAGKLDPNHVQSLLVMWNPRAGQVHRPPCTLAAFVEVQRGPQDEDQIQDVMSAIGHAAVSRSEAIKAIQFANGRTDFAIPMLETKFARSLPPIAIASAELCNKEALGRARLEEVMLQAQWELLQEERQLRQVHKQ